MGKDVIVLILGRGVQALLSIAIMRAMTSFLSPAETGRYYLFVSLAAGFSFFFINPVGMYINRKLNVWHQNKTILDRFGVFNVYTLLVSIIALLVSFLWPKLSGSRLDIPVWVFAAGVSVYVYVNTWNMTIIPALNMLDCRISFVVLTVATMALGLLSSVLLVLTTGATGFAWVMGQAISFFVLAAVALFLLKQKTGESFPGHVRLLGAVDKKSLAGVRSFSLPLAGATVLMWLQLQGYRLVIEAGFGAEFLGYLAVGLGIAGSLAAVLESLVQQIYYPVFYKAISSANTAERKAAFFALAKNAIPAYVVFFFFTVSLAPQLAGVLVSARFGGVVPFIMFGAGIEFLRMTTNIMAAAAHSEMRTKVLVKPYAYGAATVCLFIYLLSLIKAPSSFVPLAMVLGWVATSFAMRHQIAGLGQGVIGFNIMGKTVLASLPFLSFILLHNHTSLLQSCFILLVAGVYFVALQYGISFRWASKRGKIKAASPLPDPDGIESMEGTTYD